MKKKLFTVCGILTMVIFASCGSSTTKEDKNNTTTATEEIKQPLSEEAAALVGKWVMSDDPTLKTTLNADGTGVETDGDKVTKSEWRINGKELCIKYLEGGYEACGAYVIKGNQLIWTLPATEIVYNKE